MPTKTDRTGTYEALFLFGASAGTEVDHTLAAVRALIEKHGGSLLHLRKWDERKLAYEVKKQKRGLYVLAFFTGPAGAPAGIYRDVSISETVLRALITDASHLSEDEMKAQEPQQPAPREPMGERIPNVGGYEGAGPSRGGYGDRGGRGGPRGGQREEALT